MLIDLVLIGIAISNQLTVIEPSELKQQIENISVPLANYGHIQPKIIWLIIISDSNDFCQLPNSSNQNFKKTKNILIQQENCQNITITYNAQKLGYKLILIKTLNQSILNNQVSKINDGSGLLTSIPTVFINKNEADKIKQVKQKTNKMVFVSIKFDTNLKDNLQTQFWISNSNRYSFQLLRSFHQYFHILKQYINFKLNIFIHINVKNVKVMIVIHLISIVQKIMMNQVL